MFPPFSNRHQAQGTINLFIVLLSNLSNVSKFVSFLLLDIDVDIEKNKASKKAKQGEIKG